VDISSTFNEISEGMIVTSELKFDLVRHRED
jgi:hypothetical protein